MKPPKFTIPPLITFFHALWLRKWTLLLIWLILAGPAGILLSMYNLPHKYTVRTIMRFPFVQGAQTNMMRDVAITQRESIIMLFQSFQVMESTINDLNLRFRIKTPHIFRKDAVQMIRYSENLEAGSYAFRLLSPAMAEVTTKTKDSKRTQHVSITEGSAVKLRGLTVVFKEDFLRNPPQNDIEFTFSTIDQSIDDLRDALQILSKGLVNYEILLQDRDPWLAANILNNLREKFLEVYYGTTEVQDVSVLAQLEKNLELAKDRLEVSQQELSDYYKRHPSLLNASQPSQDNTLEYFDYKTRLSALEENIQRLERAYSAKPASDDTEAMIFWASDILGMMTDAGESKSGIIRGRIFGLSQTLKEQKQKFNPGHPKIQETEASLNSVLSQIDSVYAGLSKTLKSKKADLNFKTSQSKPIQQFRPSVKVELELERLMTANRNHEEAYNNLLSTYNRAKLSTGSEFFKVTVVDVARPAIYKPPTLRNRLIIAGSVVCVLFFLLPFLYLLKIALLQKIHTREDVIRMLDQKPLGVIILNRKYIRNRFRARVFRFLKIFRFKKKSVLHPAPQESPLLLHFGAMHSVQDLECYRTIREACKSRFGQNDGHPFCLLTTSSRPAEGKSIITSNLGISFARTGRRVIIVDAELRLGSIHTQLGADLQPGLTEILKSCTGTSGEIEAFLEKHILPTRQENLSFISRGRSDPGAGELVDMKSLQEIIRALKSRYDIVLIDTPPMITADSLALVNQTDGILFICYAGLTGVSESREALHTLAERGVKTGVVVNGIQISPFQQFQLKKYSYYYRPTDQTLEKPA